MYARDYLNGSELAYMPHAKAAGAAAAPPATATGPLAVWTRGDDKLLEMLLVRYPLAPWDIIASRLVGKTPEQALQRYERTVDEVTRVLRALEVETPREWDAPMVVAASSVAVAVPAAAADVTAAAAGEEEEEEEAAVTEKQATSSAADGEPSKLGATKRKRWANERKKAEKWTEEEHNLFLEGLEKYGTGKWKTMSSEYLTTKTANQIASHYQKHRKRLEQRKRNACKRASIHDITEPTTSVAVGGGEPAARKDDGVEPMASAELVRAAFDEAFPGEYDLESLFT